MKYALEITTSAEKELHKYPQKFQDRLIDKIFSLENLPRP